MRIANPSKKTRRKRKKTEQAEIKVNIGDELSV